VAGLGNRFRGDDGVGLALVDWLADCCPRGVSIVHWEDADALTLTYYLLSLNGPVLLVDSAEMGLLPGTARLMDRTCVRLQEPVGAASSHGLGIGMALELAEALSYTQPVWFFGVQPASLEGQALSTLLQAEWEQLTRNMLAAVLQICHV
jgi:hydrogenase maturation protease